MDDVQGFNHEFLFDDKGNVALRSALCTGNDADAVSTQGGKQFSGNTGGSLHVFADNGDRCQILLQTKRIEGTHGNFFFKYLVEYLTSKRSVVVLDTDGDTHLGGCLTDEEYTDMVLGQRRENQSVHSDNAHHGRTGKGNQAYSLDGRDTGDGSVFANGVLFDDGAFPLGIEGVFNQKLWL